jgi:hypothetical protein
MEIGSFAPTPVVAAIASPVIKTPKRIALLHHNRLFPIAAQIACATAAPAKGAYLESSQAASKTGGNARHRPSSGGADVRT